MADNDKPVRGNEMDDLEIDEALKELGQGVFALTRDDSTYGVPISFGYDGKRLHLYLIQFGGESKMRDFSEETKTA